MHYKYFRFDIDPKRVPNFPDLQDQIEVSNHPAMKSDNSNIVYIPGNNSKNIPWLKFRSNEQQTGNAKRLTLFDNSQTIRSTALS